LTKAELEATNPDVEVVVLGLNVAPDPKARVERVHVHTTNVTRKRLLEDRKPSARALGTIRNAFRLIAPIARKHIGADDQEWGLLTHKPVADALTCDRDLLRLVLPRGVTLSSARIGYYGRDERGSNRFRGVQVLVTFGDPIANIGATGADANVLGVD